MSVVLVVEDEEQVRVPAESILEELGHKSLSATTIAETLALLQEAGTVDLLFTDIELALDVAAGIVHPGLQLAPQAVAIRPALRVLYTSGQSVTDGMRALFVKDSEFLPKPYSFKDLDGHIKKMISGL